MCKQMEDQEFLKAILSTSLEECTHSLALSGTWCSRAAGWLLPQPGGLELSKCSLSGIRSLCVLVVSIHLAGHPAVWPLPWWWHSDLSILVRKGKKPLSILSCCSSIDLSNRPSILHVLGQMVFKIESIFSFTISISHPYLFSTFSYPCVWLCRATRSR